MTETSGFPDEANGARAGGPGTETGASRLAALEVELGYDSRIISRELSVAIPDHRFTAIIGPNACGKSTLLRALSRVLRPGAGQVILDGEDIHRLPVKEVARRLALLPQTSLAPDGITVQELVGRGRFPHQSFLRQWSPADALAVEAAMLATATTELAGRTVDELSGGQRQRVWIAMTLAQESDLMLLDEPTTYLDIAHQIELMELFSRLNREHGRTLVAVLHDLNQAFRYADHVIAMRAGRVVAEGSPLEIGTSALVKEVFGLACRIIDDPVSGTPLVVPEAPGG